MAKSLVHQLSSLREQDIPAYRQWLNEELSKEIDRLETLKAEIESKIGLANAVENIQAFEATSRQQIADEWHKLTDKMQELKAFESSLRTKHEEVSIRETAVSVKESELQTQATNMAQEHQAAIDNLNSQSQAVNTMQTALNEKEIALSKREAAIDSAVTQLKQTMKKL